MLDSPRPRRALVVLLGALALGLTSAPAAMSAEARLAWRGAYRLAGEGRDAAAILRAAFPAARIERRPAATLRVLVADLAPQIVVAGGSPLTLVDEGRPASAARTIPAGHRYRVTRRGDGFAVDDLDAPGARLALAGPLRVDAGTSAAGVRLAEPLDLRYRGALRLLPGVSRTIMAVNEVGLEPYLLGVLPGELPPPPAAGADEALVAGAIAARSRALAARLPHAAEYDATVDDPLYLGLDGERPETTRAVRASAGLVLSEGAVPLAAYLPTLTGGPSVRFAPSPGDPDPVAQAPARPIVGAPAGVGAQAVDAALAQIGTPYVWGGSRPGGFDCSGLVYWVYAQLGVPLPRVAEDQARVGIPVPRDDLEPGDAVFFADSSGYVHHEGIYVGGGRFVHAPQTGARVRVEELTGYYARQYAGARRFSPSA